MSGDNVANDKLTKSYDVTYSSYSGCDIVASITIPNFSAKPFVIGELQTVSYSIHREVSPVRTLGRVNPRSFTAGTRTIAGSLIFTVFDSNLVHKIVRLIKEGYPLTGAGSKWKKYEERLKDIGPYSVMDEMPPFDITINFTNEYGNYSTLVIKGIVIVDEGQVMSIEDMITENTMSYMATDIQVLTSKGVAVPPETTKETTVVSVPSDVTLKSLTVQPGEMPKFDPATTTYTVLLPKETTELPSITAVPNEPSSKVEISEPSKFTGTTRIRVTGKDGRFFDYYIKYKLVSRDASLKDLTINGITVDNFSQEVYNYGMGLYGAKAAPKVVGVPNDSSALVTVHRTFALPGKTDVVVTADDGVTQKTYSVYFFVFTEDSNAYLKDLVTSVGTLWPAFNKEILSYKNIVPFGETTIPRYNAITDSEQASFVIAQPEKFTDIGTVTVTAEDGTTKKIYKCTAQEDHKLFEDVFHNVGVGEMIVFDCRIAEHYGEDNDAIAFDSYMDVPYEGHSVYINFSGLSMPMADWVQVTGQYRGYIETTHGLMYHVIGTNVDYKEG